MSWNITEQSHRWREEIGVDESRDVETEYEMILSV